MKKAGFLNICRSINRYCETPMKELAADVEKAFSVKHPSLDLDFTFPASIATRGERTARAPTDNLWFTLRQYDEFWLDKPFLV